MIHLFEKRRARIRVGALFLALGIVLAFASVAQAVHDLEFELDGNTADQTTDLTSTPDFDESDQYDWENFFTADSNDSDINPDKLTLPAGFNASGIDADYAVAVGNTQADTSAYATGSKDDLSISPGWQCKKANNLGDKFDVVNAYAVGYVSSLNHLIVYFGVERRGTEGSGNVGFWLLHDGDVNCNTTAGGNQAFAGDHEDGDTLIVSEFTGGGATATVKAYRWNGTDNGGSLDEANPIIEGGKCGVDPETPSGPDDLVGCAIVNSAPITPPWVSPQKGGLTSIATNAFFEGAVDLGPISEVGCFSTFIANSRSSHEPDSTIHDFSRGSFDVCEPSTTLGVSSNATSVSGTPTVHGGESVQVTFTETNDGNTVLTSPSVTATVTPNSLTCNPAQVTQASTNNVGDTNGVGGTGNGVFDPGEAWQFRCTITPAAGTGEITVSGVGHGIDPEGNDVTVCPGNPEPADGTIVQGTPDKLCDSQEDASITIDVINPGTSLNVDVTATYTFKEKNEGDTPLSSVDVLMTGCDSSGEKFATGSSTINAGDTNSNDVFDPGETWLWTCTVSITDNGTKNVSAKGVGTDPLGDVVRFCPVSESSSSQICDAREGAEGSVSVNSTPTPTPTAT